LTHIFGVGIFAPKLEASNSSTFFSETKQREIRSDLNGEYSQTSATIVAEKRAKVGKSMEYVDPSWFLQYLSPELHFTMISRAWIPTSRSASNGNAQGTR